MFNIFERKVAFRYLRARQQEGFISIIAGFSFLGITLGVATLIIVMSVMNGFREELLSKILGFNGHLGVYGLTKAGITDFDDIADKIRSVPNVVSAAPIIKHQVLITHKGQSVGAVVHGERLQSLAGQSYVAQNIKYGSLRRFNQDNAILIGKRMSENLGALPGDSITLLSPKGYSTVFGTMPRFGRFRVAGVFEVGMSQYDSSILFIPLTTAQKFFQLPEAVTDLEIFVKNPENVRNITNKIRSLIGSKYHILDWQEINSSYFGAIQVERNVMFIILTLIIFVAAFNIISSLIMLVKDRGRDIAIIRTMGATKGMIMRIFFIIGSSIGVAGTLGGVAIGLAFAINIESIRQGIQSLLGQDTELFNPEIYFLSQLPAKVDPMEVIVVISVSLGLSFLATLYPAWLAARLDPVEALRYE